MTNFEFFVNFEVDGMLGSSDMLRLMKVIAAEVSEIAVKLASVNESKQLVTKGCGSL